MPIDISTFIKKRKKLDTSINIANMVILPSNDPNNNLFRLVCLLNTIAVAKRSNRSKPKFNNSTKSI